MPEPSLPTDFGPIADPSGLSGTEWLFAEEAAPLTAEKEIESFVALLFARFLGRDVLTVSFLDDSPRLLAIGSVERLPGVRAAESFLNEVWTCTFCTGARWALPMSFATRPRRAAYLLPVDGRCWFRLDDLDGFRALLGGAWLTPAVDGGHSDFGPTIDPNGLSRSNGREQRGGRAGLQIYPRESCSRDFTLTETKE